MNRVGTVYSKVLKQRINLYKHNGRIVPCVCDSTFKCIAHRNGE